MTIPADFSLFQIIIDALPIHLYWTDKDLKLKGCNYLQAKNFGMTVKEAIGKTMNDFAELFGWPDDFVAGINTVHQTVMRTREHHSAEYQAIMLDKIEHTFLNYNYPLIMDDKVEGIVGISFDITELKNTQKELEIAKEKAEMANQAKSNFLTTISHELRTPLNGILGVTQIMQSDDVPRNVDSNVSLIEYSARNLLKLINQILDFSKIEAQKIELKSENFSLFDLVNDCVSSLAQIAKNKDLEIISNFENNIPRNVVGDREKMLQILTNIIGNSIKFTNEGQICISVSSEVIDVSYQQYKILVSDTGIGIRKQDLNLIFDQFSQVESSYKRRYEGTGLGLSIAKSLIELMGGEIGVDSALGEGSTFIICIPFKVDETSVKRSASLLQKKILKKFNFSILLVEDNEINQKVACMMLNSFGCKVDIAHNGREALEKAQKNVYDLILMDLSLPDMDGLEVTRKIQSSVTLMRDSTPIVALTAHALEETKNDCISAGMLSVITKPIEKLEILDLLKSIELL